jgi:predicted Zn-dependent protease
MHRLIATLLLAAVMSGCATNPVTGRKEIQMVSEQQEIQLGQQYYGPSRQSQGGDYVTDPAVNAYVQQVGRKLAAVADRPLPYEFVVLNSSELNAWALPGGKIAINRGLLVELKNEAELAAVLGHEIVHAAARHGAQQMEKGQLMQIGAAVAAIGATAYGGSSLGQVVGQGAAVGAQLLSAKYGREDELEADRYGMIYMKRAGYDLQAAVSLQELFVRKFQAGNDQDWMTGLFASHPPSQERVNSNRRVMTELGGPGGDTGADRYAAAMTNLKRAAPAYEKQQQAIEAANRKDYATARRQTNEAVKIEPRESRFHGLLGDLAMAEKNPRAALPHYQKAGQLDQGYFKPMVQQGMAQYQLGNSSAATPLLEQSMTLLPTAPGAYYLGRINEDRGNLPEAVRLYKLAAGSNSPIGQEAQGRLVRLDLAQNPETYLAIQPQLDKQGRVWLSVGNRTSVPLTDVIVLVGVVDPSSGRTIHGPERIGTGSSAIPPRQAVNLRTSLGPFGTSEVLPHVKWKVERAQPASAP